MERFQENLRSREQKFEAFQGVSVQDNLLSLIEHLTGFYFAVDAWGVEQKKQGRKR